MSYALKKTTSLKFEDAVEKISLCLREQGFGIITEIDMKKTFKEKLNTDFRPYKILGACNPGFALKALSLEEEVGTLLPCNVVVQSKGNSNTEVMAMDPVAMMSPSQNPALIDMAKEVQTLIQNALNNLPN
jgi:uncharacterized protein (DUF302 family)